MNRPHLTPQTLATAVDLLTAQDGTLASVVKRVGPPPFFRRDPGFKTLLLIILEQQVSLASAQAAYRRLLAAADGTLTPQTFLRFSDADLRSFGFSRQKTRYGRVLAAALLSGDLDLDGLATQSDAAARAALTALTGIGRWTANVYLMMALQRPDVWPVGDRALAVSIREVYALERVPGAAALESWGDRYAPRRTAAAFILWHAYLERRKS